MTIERYRDDKPDLDQRLRLSTILQALSPQLAPRSTGPTPRPATSSSTTKTAKSYFPVFLA